MRIPRPHILLDGIQVKSLEKAQRLAAALNVIEEECGIHEVRLTIREPFVCPWIDLTQLDGTPMERLVRDMLMAIDRKRRGADSPYAAAKDG